MAVAVPILFTQDMSQMHSVIISELGCVSCTVPPMVERNDSTVVGILQWSLASGESVGDCVQGGRFSEKQGTSYLIHSPQYTTFCHKHPPIK